MNSNLVETLIGAVVLAVALFFLAFAYTAAGVGSGLGGYELQARFNRADGLVIGGDVRLSGIKIGTITRQSLDPQTYAAIVAFTVDERYQLPEDTAVKIASEGLLGGNYLEISPGASDVTLAAGDEITNTQGAIDLLNLLMRFGTGKG